MRLTPGQAFNRTYRVERFLGAGGFGEVYLVTHRFLGGQALKVLHLPRDVSAGSAFSEARILMDLNHPNIVRTYDADLVGEGDGDVGFMTMEYAEAGTLADRISTRIRFSAPDVLSMARQLARGLAVTHKRSPPLIHGDVKPSNVLVFDEGVLIYKLSDFGLAKSLDPETRLVSSGGTAAYAAPEIAWGVADERSDIYSLGVTLYRCLTGIHPFPIQTTQELSLSKDLRQSLSIGRKTILRPSRQMLRVATPLDDIIMTCLEYDMFQRFRNAQELKTALQTVDVK